MEIWQSSNVSLLSPRHSLYLSCFHVMWSLNFDIFNYERCIHVCIHLCMRLRVSVNVCADGFVCVRIYACIFVCTHGCTTHGFCWLCTCMSFQFHDEQCTEVCVEVELYCTLDLNTVSTSAYRYCQSRVVIWPLLFFYFLTHMKNVFYPHEKRCECVMMSGH